MALAPTKEQAKQLGASFNTERTDYDLDLLREYLAIGLGYWQGVAWVEIVTDGGWLLSVPLFLFEITDPKASKYWEIRTDGASTTLWPPSLYEPDFNSQLADDVPSAVETLRELRALMEAEAFTV